MIEIWKKNNGLRNIKICGQQFSPENRFENKRKVTTTELFIISYSIQL